MTPENATARRPRRDRADTKNNRTSEGSAAPGRRQPFLFEWRKAIAESELRPLARHVALALSTHMDGAGGSCFPGIDKLAHETGLSDRSVQRAIRDLVRGEYLLIEANAKGGRVGRKYLTPRYRATLPGRGDTVTPLNAAGVTETTGRGDKDDAEGRHSVTQGRTEEDEREESVRAHAPLSFQSAAGRLLEDDCFKCGARGPVTYRWLCASCAEPDDEGGTA